MTKIETYFFTASIILLVLLLSLGILLALDDESNYMEETCADSSYSYTREQ